MLSLECVCYTHSIFSGVRLVPFPVPSRCLAIPNVNGHEHITSCLFLFSKTNVPLEGQDRKMFMEHIRFNKKELLAILNIAYGMAEIDGKSDAIELEVIRSEIKTFGIDENELLSLSEDAILNMDPHTAMSIVAEMTPVQKQYIQAILIVIMSSDGKIHEKEMIMLRMVTMMCGLPPINQNDIRTTLTNFKNR